MRTLLTITAALVLFACNTQGVNKTKSGLKKIKVQPNVLDQSHRVLAHKKLDNGIVIDWYEQGNGELLKDEDFIHIDYKVKLIDGTVVDGNHLIRPKKEFLPFVIGFGMQTPGWDLALKELKVGDFAKIIIPAKLARGEKGIKGIIPPNADNILVVRVLEKVKPLKEIEGTKIWLLEENKRNKIKFSANNQIVFHAKASSKTTPWFTNTFQNGVPFSYKLSDYGLVPGLQKALINAKKSDMLYVLVPSEQAYGTKGYLDIVKPNESVLYTILVMDVQNN